MVERIQSKRPKGVAHKDAHDEKGKFVKGHVAYSRAGRGDRRPAILKDAILEGAALVGYDGKGKDGLLGYCRMLATKYPKNYTYLLGKTLPLTVRDGQVHVGPITIRVSPVEPGRFLTSDDMLKLTPHVIDNEPLQPQDEQDGVTPARKLPH